MRYESTRDSKIKILSSQAIVKGISQEGGLFVPETIPALTKDEMQALAVSSYREKAEIILSKFLTDFTAGELCECINSAYTLEKFGSDTIAPLVRLDSNAYMLELWHGPTCAFKDMALQLMPHLLTTSMKKSGGGKKVAILVATSGDTGKAALEGFKNVPDTQILVFYPEGGISALQKMQMATQEGENVSVCAIHGNFDDAQTAVKSIFNDEGMRESLAALNKTFSSANSINWGRLVPQIVYYFSSYFDLLKSKAIQPGEKINFVVPTGNFGNILSAYYAKQMGLPVNKFICASNTNNILTEFINKGEYNCNRKFFTTISPSMDIIISSNLERLLYHLSGRDDEYIKSIFAKLKSDNFYNIEPDLRTKLQEEFYGGYCDEAQTKAEIKRIYREHSYTVDPHTAVGIKVYRDYRENCGDDTKTIIASTASPYKFPESVVCAITGGAQGTAFELTDKLCELSGQPVPQNLQALKTANVRFDRTVQPENMAAAVIEMISM